MYAFYEKPMKSQFVLMKDSAVPMKTKRNALTQEVKRRLRNCHDDLPKEEVAEVLSKFSQKLSNSGYNQSYREQVINAGVLAYNYKEDIGREERGEKKRFRSRGERKSQLGLKKSGKW